MIELKNVSKKVNNINILNNINIKFSSKGLYIIKGVNGSGKSTLLNLIGGLDRPTDGSIIFNNIDITDLSNTKLSEYREKYISFIFQDSNLFENMSVIENINIVNTDDNIDKILKKLDIYDIKDKKVKNISGGEKQKTSIARSIIKKCDVLICDEPTSSLDYEKKDDVFKILKELSLERLVILVSHDEYLINKYADVVIEIKNGSINDIVNNNYLQSDILNNSIVNKNKFNINKFLLENCFTNKKKIFISSFLLVLSFVFIILSLSFSSINYNKLHSSTLIKNNDNLVIFNKNKYLPYSNTYVNDNLFTLEDVMYLDDVLDSDVIIGKNINVDGYPMNFGINYDKKSNIPYYQKFVNNLSFVDINQKELDLSIIGKEPKQSNEIMISSYLADLMIKFGVKDYEKQDYNPQSYEEIISDKRPIILGTNNVIISGIYKIDLSKFEKLKEECDNPNSEILSLKELFNNYIDNLGSNIYVNKNFFDLYSNILPTINVYYDFSLEENKIGRYTILNSKPIIFSNSIKLQSGEYLDTLNKNEIIVNSEILNLLNLNMTNCLNKKITMYIYDSSSGNFDYIDKLSLTIKGVSNDNDYYMNNETLEKFLDKTIYINKAFSIVNDKIIEKTLKTFPLKNNKFTITTNYSEKIIDLNEVINFISKIFIIASIIFTLITIIFTVNYFLNSLELHKKDIGILKSFGINDKIITSIFIYELFVIIILSYILSIILSIVISTLGNYIITNLIYIKADFIIIKFNILLSVLISIIIILCTFYLLYYNKNKKMLPILMFKDK